MTELSGSHLGGKRLDRWAITKLIRRTTPCAHVPGATALTSTTLQDTFTSLALSACTDRRDDILGHTDTRLTFHPEPQILVYLAAAVSEHHDDPLAQSALARGPEFSRQMMDGGDQRDGGAASRQRSAGHEVESITSCPFGHDNVCDIRVFGADRSTRGIWGVYDRVPSGVAHMERGNSGMDIAGLADAVMPYVTAAIGAYGAAVWTKAQDAAADETVSLGRRLLQRLHQGERARPRLEDAVADLIAAPDDADFQAGLRGQIRKALAGDEMLATEITAMLNASPIVAALGSQVVSGSHVGGDAIQIGSARDVDIRRRS
ncbi:hypothetical protein J5X84_44440 [Streptosporangiaceae bacterium NEAU-GS5]|nr:hypothetical protein [Streptosporangiaceae bacterium NEAU-GS5]